MHNITNEVEMKKNVWLLLLLPFLLWSGLRVYDAVQFSRNCGGYLKRAGDANTVPLAKRELARALAYIESNGLTKGYTSILYTTPDEELGFWYENLKVSHAELLNVKPDAGLYETSNVLMKSRGTLLDGNGTVTIPSGISVYPNNTEMAMFGVLSFIAAVVGCVIGVRKNL
jgi:hypothetical protein